MRVKEFPVALYRRYKKRNRKTLFVFIQTQLVVLEGKPVKWRSGRDAFA